jgi:hypothetical protein
MARGVVAPPDLGHKLSWHTWLKSIDVPLGEETLAMLANLG